MTTQTETKTRRQETTTVKKALQAALQRSDKMEKLIATFGLSVVTATLITVIRKMSKAQQVTITADDEDVIAPFQQFAEMVEVS